MFLNLKSLLLENPMTTELSRWIRNYQGFFHLLCHPDPNYREKKNHGIIKVFSSTMSSRS